MEIQPVDACKIGRCIQRNGTHEIGGWLHIWNLFVSLEKVRFS
jgi:hypothetical protein